MEQNQRIQKPLNAADDGVWQEMRESIALRKELGIVGNKMTTAQEKLYLDAKRKLWLEKHPHALSGGPEPSPEPKS